MDRIEELKIAEKVHDEYICIYGIHQPILFKDYLKKEIKKEEICANSLCPNWTHTGCTRKVGCAWEQ